MKVSFKVWIFLTAQAAFWASAGSAMSAETLDSLLIESGKSLAEKNCAMCHAIGKTGESPNPSSPPFRSLSRKYPVDSLEEALAEGISVGHAEMPQFEFEPRQIDGLIAYLKSLHPQGDN